jgi:broad specificity phosphatase PhoE
MKIYLIRHGETDYSLQRRYCGFSDPPLNERGIWQANRLADKFKGIKIGKIFSSDLIRASETAKIAFKDEPIIKYDKLREINFGIFEGMAYQEICTKYNTLYSKWIENPMTISIPSGEMMNDFIERIDLGFSYIQKNYRNEDIVIVTHAGPIRIILFNAMFSNQKNQEIDLQKMWQIDQHLGAVSIIEYSKEGKPEITSKNDISHLGIEENNF